MHLLPTLWFRNIWAWWPDEPKPSLKAASWKNGAGAIATTDALLGDYFLHCEGHARLLFTENETNNERLFGRSRRHRKLSPSLSGAAGTGSIHRLRAGELGTPSLLRHPGLAQPGEIGGFVQRANLRRPPPTAGRGLQVGDA